MTRLAATSALITSLAGLVVFAPSNAFAQYGGEIQGQPRNDEGYRPSNKPDLTGLKYKPGGRYELTDDLSVKAVDAAQKKIRQETGNPEFNFVKWKDGDKWGTNLKPCDHDHPFMYDPTICRVLPPKKAGGIGAFLERNWAFGTDVTVEDAQYARIVEAERVRLLEEAKAPAPVVEPVQVAAAAPKPAGATAPKHAPVVQALKAEKAKPVVVAAVPAVQIEINPVTMQIGGKDVTVKYVPPRNGQVYAGVQKDNTLIHVAKGWTEGGKIVMFKVTEKNGVLNYAPHYDPAVQKEASAIVAIADQQQAQYALAVKAASTTKVAVVVETPKEEIVVTNETPVNVGVSSFVPKVDVVAEAEKPADATVVAEKPKDETVVTNETPVNVGVSSFVPKVDVVAEAEKPADATVVVEKTKDEVVAAGGDARADATVVAEKPKDETVVAEAEKPADVTVVAEKPKDETVVVEAEKPADATVVAEKPKDETVVVEAEKPADATVEAEKPKDETIVAEAEKPADATVVVEKPKDEAVAAGGDAPADVTVVAEKPKDEIVVAEAEKPADATVVAEKPKDETIVAEAERLVEELTKAGVSPVALAEAPAGKPAAKEEPKDEVVAEAEKPAEEPAAVAEDVASAAPRIHIMEPVVVNAETEAKAIVEKPVTETAVVKEAAPEAKAEVKADTVKIAGKDVAVKYFQRKDSAQVYGALQMDTDVIHVARIWAPGGKNVMFKVKDIKGVTNYIPHYSQAVQDQVPAIMAIVDRQEKEAMAAKAAPAPASVVANVLPETITIQEKAQNAKPETYEVATVLRFAKPEAALTADDQPQAYVGLTNAETRVRTDVAKIWKTVDGANTAFKRVVNDNLKKASYQATKLSGLFKEKAEAMANSKWFARKTIVEDSTGANLCEKFKSVAAHKQANELGVEETYVRVVTGDDQTFDVSTIKAGRHNITYRVAGDGTRARVDLEAEKGTNRAVAKLAGLCIR
jgi:hypothetical protein